MLQVPLPSIDLFAVSPLIAMTVTASVLLLITIFAPRVRGAVYPLVTLAGLLVTLGFVLALLAREPVVTFSGSWRADQFSQYFGVTVLLAAMLAVLISDSWLRLHQVSQVEYYAVLVCSTAGMIVSASAYDLMTLFLGIELMSVPTYVLTGFAKHRRESNEGAMKYFLLGAFSSAILLYGMTWTYGVTGSTRFDQIASFAAQGGAARPAVLLAMLLMVAGLGFKVAAVPFHQWTPDAYQGAPTVVTAFMSVAVKAGAFAALVRLLTQALPGMLDDWRPILIVISILTMLIGNLAAIAQTDVKRMLAYSSIGHTGFMLVGLAMWSRDNTLGASSVLFYALAYVFMNLGAFGVLAWMENHGGGTTLEHMDGLFARAPAAGLALGIFLLGLMGFPLTIGLPAKVFVFLSAVRAGHTWLAVLGFLISAVAAVYYLRVLARLFAYEPRYALASPRQPLMVLGLAICATATVVFGLLFVPLLDFAERAVGS